MDAMESGDDLPKVIPRICFHSKQKTKKHHSPALLKAAETPQTTTPSKVKAADCGDAHAEQCAIDLRSDIYRDSLSNAVHMHDIAVLCSGSSWLLLAAPRTHGY